MKIKNEVIFNAMPILNKIIEKDLDGKAAYKFKTLLQKLSPIMESIEHGRNTLIKNYGEDTGNGNIRVKDENFQVFMIEFKKILDEEQEVEINKVVIDTSLEPNKNFAYSTKEAFITETFLEVI